jgi:hypothetical protein
MTTTAPHFHVGHNTPGYLPDGDGGVNAYRSFGDAKAALIGDLKFTEEYAADETEAENASAAAEDANLWAESDLLLEWSVTVDNGAEHGLGTAFWVMTCAEDCELEDEDVFTTG